MSVLVRMAMVALFAVGTCLATAEAGGGSSKNNSTITVRNNTQGRVAVLLLREGQAAPTTEAQFNAAGGKVLEAGRSVAFRNVRNGDYHLAVAPVFAGIPAPEDFDAIDVDVTGSNQTFLATDIIGVPAAM